jgi:tripartite-type tricarboxylate transporter receptor subunit TctC
LSVLPLVSVMLLLAPAAATAQSVQDFYRSKPITMILGGGVGGGYDA